MAEIINEWLPFDAAQPKKKRAESVCVLCHSKKVKCDLQARSIQGHSACSNCSASNKKCELRPSKRARRSSPATANRGSRPPTPQTESVDDTATAIGQDVLLDPIQLLISPQVDRQQLDCSSGTQLDTAAGIVGQHQSPSTPVGLATLFSQPTGHFGPPSTQTSHRSIVSQPDVVVESLKGDIDTGFLQVYGPENSNDAEKQAQAESTQQRLSVSDLPHQDLIESFAETYFEYCYAWCPVLDPDSIFEEISRSPLLENALATAGSNIQPPLIPHSGPAEYYAQARSAFYNDEEADTLTTLKSIALFYWWAPRAATTVHRHSSWWWTSVLIRHAQQMNLHRQPSLDPKRSDHTFGMRRRIWWTAFARERLTALCQSKPAIIDPDDCNVDEPTLADFPSEPRFQRKGEIFIWWIRLCAIIGRVAKTLYGPINKTNSGSTASSHIQELSDWVNSLPAHLQLPIQTARTQNFDKDIHQLHLPYLTTVIILHLKRCEHPLPQALPPAILAASCVARILRDVLARGNTRFLMAITCWYSGTAYIPLLQSSHIPRLSKDANECLDILERAVEQLQKMWASANIIHEGFRRLRNTAEETCARTAILDHLPNNPPAPLQHNHANDLPGFLNTKPQNMPIEERDFDWTALFPFVTRQTSNIANTLLTGKEQGVETRALPSPENGLFNEILMAQFDDLFAIDGYEFMPTFA